MKRLLALGLLAVALAACGVSAASPTAGLAGTFWTLVEMDGRAPMEPAPTLVIGADGAISGNASCNSYHTTARIQGSSISIGPVSTTMMACAGAIGLQERKYLAALDEANAWDIDGSGRLVLEGGDVLVFEPAPTPS